MHVVVWGGLLSIPFLPDLWDNEVVGLSVARERVIKASLVGLVVAVFYVSYAVLAPRLFFTKRYGAYLFSALGVRLAALGVCLLLGMGVTFADPSFTRSALPVLGALFIVFMLASMAGTGLRMIREWRRLKAERDAQTHARALYVILYYASVNTCDAKAAREHPTRPLPHLNDRLLGQP